MIPHFVTAPFCYAPAATMSVQPQAMAAANIVLPFALAKIFSSSKLLMNASSTSTAGKSVFFVTFLFEWSNFR